jgi:glyoxylase-like metal-dependent hydrolase (beta-lactamase superfamily II)
MLVVTPLASNCYILHEEDTRRAVVVDAGGDAPEILQIIRTKGLKVEAILCTHGHIDHVGANAEVRRATGAPIAIHPADAAMLTSEVLSGARWCGLPFEEHTHDLLLLPGEPVPGPFPFQVHHTPGHCPGSVVLWLPDRGLALGGDLIFEGSIGRTDLPGGDPDAMDESLRRIMGLLPDDTTILPGHGRPTTIGDERRTNPYIKAALRSRNR